MRKYKGERLEAIIQKDLDYIFTEYRDYTKETVIQTGSEKLTVWADLQSSAIEMDSSEKAVNAYAVKLLVRSIEIPKSFRKKLTKDAILYVNGDSYKVIDVADDGGLYSISLERGTSRGSTMSGREA